MEVDIDLADFREAAITAGKINGDNRQDLNFGPINRIADSLEILTDNEEEFLKTDPVTRCLLRGGAKRLVKKHGDDRELFHFLCEMLPNVRRIAVLDEERRTQTIKFLEGVACM